MRRNSRGRHCSPSLRRLTELSRSPGSTVRRRVCSLLSRSRPGHLIAVSRLPFHQIPAVFLRETTSDPQEVPCACSATCAFRMSRAERATATSLLTSIPDRFRRRMTNDRSNEETDDPLYADDRNFYKVEAWDRDGIISFHCPALRRQKFD